MGALQQAYVLQRRFADAIAAGAAAHALDPNDLNQVEWQAIAYLAQGDLPGARGVIRSAIGGNVTAPAMAAFFGGYQELSWALEPEGQALLLRLTPAAFDNDRAWWGQTTATAYWERGDKAMARAYADSALAPSAAQVAASPGDAQVRSLYALMLAYLGRAAEARAEADTAASLVASATANNRSYAIMQRARINLAIGDTGHALDAVELLLKQPYMVTPAWLRIDPTFASLKGNPRFERLIAQ
jgi:tetratricopeptide (TPR) repeat protein